MSRFAYRALTIAGEEKAGEVSAQDEAQALDLIARQGLTPVWLRSGSQPLPWWQREFSFSGKVAPLKPSEMGEFFTSFAALIEAKLPLASALGHCERQAKGRTRLQSALARARLSVENGSTLAQGLRDAAPVFPERWIAVIQSGEQANRLESVVRRAAETLASEERRRREIRAALIYPAILLLMSLLVVGMVIFYLSPTLLPVFTSTGREPPALLVTLNWLGEVLHMHWLGAIVALTVLIAAASALRTRYKDWLFPILLRTPLVGAYFRRIETAQICQTLALMMEGGAPLMQALSVLRGGRLRGPYRTLIEETSDCVAAGGTLTSALQRSDLIDPTAMILIAAGEQSDRLPTSLRSAALTLEGMISQTTSQFVRMLTPILTLLLGGSVGALILSTVTAIMDLNEIAF
ncbi:type II secretion system F family protein [Frigidibacter sp. SD6-1]|uniref:type II secretion system F family protein n=1 Tax=Frigidibacter sp. SD6-1 TaxID=3032581 RepID=UPI0024DF4170|nr:type II secretion system F family protein [Frigidibacter sp. SD6-1]